MISVTQSFRNWLDLMKDLEMKYGRVNVSYTPESALLQDQQDRILQELQEITGASQEFLEGAVGDAIEDTSTRFRHLEGDALALQIVKTTVRIALQRECTDMLLRKYLN